MKNKIKILYVMDHFDTNAGGTEGQIYNLIKNLDRKRFSPELCLFRYVNDFFMENDFPCPVFSIGIETFHSLRSYRKLLQLRRYIREEGIDIVQTVFNDSALSIPPILAGLRIRLVSTRRDMGFWYTPFKKMVLGVNSLFTDRYLVNSSAIKRNLLANEFARDRKVHVINNGHNSKKFLSEPDKYFFENNGIPFDSRIIGIVAHLRPVKQVDRLIIAHTKILRRYPETYLVIAGDDSSLGEEYRKLVQAMGIAERVRFLGVVEEIIPVMKHFDVGVNCSESEGLSNTIIEYMGCGVPTVATDNEGNRELIQHGQNGLLVPVGDPEALANAVIALLDDKNLRERVIGNGRRFAKNRFEESRIVEMHEMFYWELCGLAHTASIPN